MRVKINRAGKFGNFLANFGAKCFSHIHARGNKSGRQIWDTLWQILVQNFLNQIHVNYDISRHRNGFLPLVALLCSALELQNIEFLK